MYDNSSYGIESDQPIVYEFPKESCGDLVECHDETIICIHVSLPDMETCSICLVEVEFDTLTYIDSGEGLCNDCLDDELNSNAIHNDYLDSIRD